MTKGIRRREEGETTSSQTPTHKRNCKNDNDDEAKRMEYMRSKGGGRLKHCIVDGDVPLCLRRNLRDSKEASSSVIKRYEEKESRSSTQSKMKHCVMNKTASGSKDTCPRSTEEKDKHPKNKEVTFIILQKNMRSMHSSEKIEELVTELEGYRWDAILLNETWRLNGLNFGRHNTNTYLWELGNTITNMELGSC